MARVSKTTSQRQLGWPLPDPLELGLLLGEVFQTTVPADECNGHKVSFAVSILYTTKPVIFPGQHGIRANLSRHTADR